MLHEVGVDLATYLGSKGCPFPVIDGPELRPATTYARERIVIEHDLATADSFVSNHKATTNPRTRLSRVMACKITIHAQNPRPGAPYWEHVRRAEHVLDLVLAGLYHVSKVRQNLWEPRSGKFVYPEDLGKSETHGGATYELLFTFDRGVTNANWNGSPPHQTVTITDTDDGLSIVTTTNVSGETQDGGSSTETAP